jgi:hypothetical protein
MIDNNAPLEVRRAAQIVQTWLDSQKASAGQPAARPMTAAERYRLREYGQDSSKLPPWRDPRSA